MRATMHTHAMAGASTGTAATTMADMADMADLSTTPDMSGTSNPNSGTHGDGSTHHGPPVDPGCMQLGTCCCAPVLTKPLGVVPSMPTAPIRFVHAALPLNVAWTPPQVAAHARPFAIGPPDALV